MEASATEFLRPRAVKVQPLGTNRARVTVEPFERGFGHTLGNALRRVLLSSMPGAAIVEAEIEGVLHEYTSIEGVQEDVVDILLNLKGVVLKLHNRDEAMLTLKKNGDGTVTAGDIEATHDVEIVNPEQVLMTLDSDDVTIEMDLTVERGIGYVSADRAEALPIGVIAVDAIFTPVRKVNYWVDAMRVGQVTNYDKLTLEIETDGTLTPEEALSRAADVLVRQFQPFVNIGMVIPGMAQASGAPALPPNMLDMPIEELDLPMRAYNSLKRNNIVKVGQLLQLSDDDLLRMRNFGKKSLDEMKDRLRMRGFMLPESDSDGDYDEDEDLDDPLSVAVDAAADLVVDAAVGHAVERDLRHVLAIAAARAGRRVHVIERAREFGEIGAGSSGALSSRA